MEFGLDLSLLYEDTSSSYFEGEKCPLAGRGYSRPDHPQVNYEVGVLAGGFRLGWECMEGKCLTTG